MTLDIRGANLFNDGGKDPVIELGRLTFKSSGVCLYLPKSICALLHLDRDMNGSLVILAVDGTSILLIKDTFLASSLKSRVLEARKQHNSLKNSVTNEVEHNGK